MTVTTTATAADRYFHPVVAAWFNDAFERETPVQVAAWKEVTAGSNVLIAAPTGSGKTLAAFLCAISALVEDSAAAPLGASGADCRGDLRHRAAAGTGAGIARRHGPGRDDRRDDEPGGRRVFRARRSARLYGDILVSRISPASVSP